MSKESYIVIVEPSMSFFNYVLEAEDLTFFESGNVILFADDLKNISMFLDRLFSTNLIYYMKNIRFYYTAYYRENAFNESTLFVKKVSEIVKFRTMLYGNSVDDSLLGLHQNMKNIKHIARSKDVSILKNAFKGVPAIVVAAGPSLNKNIQYLKQFKWKAVIIAVDTIADRLIREGIIPEFICSVERGHLTYEYFYKDKIYPEEVSLVGPLLLYPEIFKKFSNEIVIPIRENVGEFIWLQEILDIPDNSSIPMGQSCAHIAFGLAEHLGTSPIILTGQDLAYGKTYSETHASDTVYDKNPVSSQETTLTEGYYGGEVKTTEIWNAFRNWFEMEIFNNKVYTINATEGGAKIKNTTQMALIDVYEKFCSENKTDLQIYNRIKCTPNYPLQINKVFKKLDIQIDNFKNLKNKFETQLNRLNKLKINKANSRENLLKALSQLENTDQLYKEISSNSLLRHNMQAMMITTIWELFEIDQILTVDTLNANKKIQLDFLETGIFVFNEIIKVLELTVAELKESV
jgi:hypothetical protein